MGRLDDSAWWWEHALDGVVGGLLGGLFTALAVIATIRHERRLQAESGTSSAVLTLLADLDALTASLVEEDAEQRRDALSGLRLASTAVIASAGRTWPEFAGEVSRLALRINEEVWSHAHGEAELSQVLHTVHALQLRLMDWTQEPDRRE